MTERRVVAFILMCIVAAILFSPIAAISLWLAIITVLVCFSLIPFTARKLPSSLDGGLKRHRIFSLLWILLGIIGIFQMARLSAFMTDASKTWGSTVPDPAAIQHQCMAAYIQAADLSRRDVPNIYSENFYPAFSSKPDGSLNKLDSPVYGLSKYLEDPYQYPPQFLLLPRAALALTNNFLHIRTVWFVLQSMMLCICAFYVGLWLSEKSGKMIILLLPALLASLPMMLNFQFGQFHAMAVILALAAMVAFEKRHLPLGGALLAFSILAKIFPAILILFLVFKKAWREVIWTFVFAVIFTLLGVAVLGTSPFHAFFSFELPRFFNGQAFSFVDREGIPLFIQARNYSIHGMIFKLKMLGVSGIGHKGSAIAAWIYTLGLIILTIFAARKNSEKNRTLNVEIWLALLILSSLRTPVAPSAYVMAPALFLLTVISGEVQGFKYGLLLFVVWILLMGLPPMPDVPELILDLVGQLLTIAICIWILLRKPTIETQPEFALKMSPSIPI